MTEGQARQKSPQTAPRPQSAAGAAPSSATTAMAKTKVRVETTASSRALSLPTDDPGRDGVRLGIIAFTTLVTALGLFILGAVAERLGIDAWLGTGPLARSLSETFVTGTRLPVVMLQSLYASGVDEPLLFGTAMALIIPPIAGLVAARPRQRGGPRPAPAVLAAGGMAAALVIGADLLVAVHLANTARPRFEDALINATWLEDLRSLSATDSIAMIFSILLAVLVFRLPIDRWVRGLAGTIAIATAVIATGAAASSAGVMSLIDSPLPVIRHQSMGVPMLQIGFNHGDETVVVSIDEDLTRRSVGQGTGFEILGSRTLASILAGEPENSNQTPPDPRP